MSWDQFVQDNIKIMSPVHLVGMCEIAILDVNTGQPWTTGFNMGKISVEDDGKQIVVDQAANLIDGLKQPDGYPTLPGGIYLNGCKYHLLDKTDTTMFLKKSEGGAVIAKTNKTLVVGLWNPKKKGEVNGEQKNQNPADCTTNVEEFAEKLKFAGY